MNVHQHLSPAADGSPAAGPLDDAGASAATVQAATVQGATEQGATVQGATVQAADEPWRDPARPVGERVSDLLQRMTLEEKLAQLAAVWLADPSDGGGVAPLQGEFTDGLPPFAEMIRDGLGELTRVFGTRPVTPAEGGRALASLQARIAGASRFGIPAIVHEECLTGFMAWGATVFPSPPAWGATFDPALVEQMARGIGRSMSAVGVHHGLAPVLDVARDSRWGRVEETIGEDPYLVGVLGTGYVRGLQSAGVLATLKHFAAYSASRAGRNMAPVSIGPRELADVYLFPFEMAIREGGARSIMASYAAIDSIPAHADRTLLTDILRECFGFDGLVVADYFGISFLEALHGVAASPLEAGVTALRAGVDVELPNGRCYGPALAGEVRAGRVPEELVDRSAARVLRQKFELGLLDPQHPQPDAAAEPRDVDLNPPEHQDLARRLAEESVVLLVNEGGRLPLGPAGRLAVIGPLADDPLAFFGGYTLPRHIAELAARDGDSSVGDSSVGDSSVGDSSVGDSSVGDSSVSGGNAGNGDAGHGDAGHGGGAVPGAGYGIRTLTVVEALRAEFPQARIEHAAGCAVRSPDRSGIPAALDCARAADVVIAVLGDEAGHFGRGSSGEGCDADDLRLPGIQADLLDQLVATGKPVVLVLVTGRPYAIGSAAGRLAAALQAFFPGQEGGGAIAGVLSGRVVPSGKLPIQLPGPAGAQPSTYLSSQLAGRTEVSSVDPTPLFPFGHGLSYTSFGYSDLIIEPAVPEPAGDGGRPVLAPEPAGDDGRPVLAITTAGTAEIGCTVRNTGDRVGDEVVQLYLRDPVAQVNRPLRYLAGFARVALQPGQARRVTFRLHADRTAFAGLAGDLVVEPGLIEVAVGSSSQDLRLCGELELHGPQRVVGPDRVLTTPVTVHDAS
jgi:beta-xylosidase